MVRRLVKWVSVAVAMATVAVALDALTIIALVALSVAFLDHMHLEAGQHYFVLTDFEVIATEVDAALPRPVVRGPRQANVSVHRIDDGFLGFPAPDDPTGGYVGPWPPDHPTAGSVVIGDFTALESGPHEISVEGDDRIHITSGHPEWREAESYQLLAQTVPLYGLTIAALGLLGLIVRPAKPPTEPS
jgi:hypothetical protein